MAAAACSWSLVTIFLYLQYPPSQLCLLPTAISLSAHNLCEDCLLFHVPEGPCTQVCTSRAEVAPVSLSPSLTHVHRCRASHICSQGERRKEEPHNTPSYSEAVCSAPHLAALEKLWTRPARGGQRGSHFLSKLLPETPPEETCRICCTLH